MRGVGWGYRRLPIVSWRLLELDASLTVHWSTLESNVALCSGEVECTADVVIISEGIGEAELYKNMCRRLPSLDLRTGLGAVKHLRAKRLWAQGAMQARGVGIWGW